MSGETAFEEINEAKANMDHIYDQRDPRAYFRELKKLGYAIPGCAKPIFQKLIAYLQRRGYDSVHVLDLGCSYGVNAALLKHDLSMPELYEHWGQQDLVGAAPEDVVAYDRRFFGDLDEQEDISVTGLDQAESAIAFAEESGLLDEGLVLNLETEPLPEAAMENLGAGRSGNIDRVRRLSDRKELRKSVAHRDAGTVAMDGQFRAADVPVRRDRGDPGRLGLCYREARRPNLCST